MPDVLEQRGRRRRRSTKAHLRIATLNMRGYSTMGNTTPEGKWLQINQLLREKRIAVLALQETHLNEERVVALNNLFSEVMEVVYSPDPSNETGARGVAYAINKRFVKQPEYHLETVVPGRAILLDLKWSGTRRLKILNVYGPNQPRLNAEFWKDLSARPFTRGVDLLLGDFNVVEAPWDRIPERSDDERATEELTELIESRTLTDGWRRMNANQRAYTYMQRGTGSQSRLDQIYARVALMQDADNWDILESGLTTDHKLALVDMADRQAPYHGKGRWAMPKHLLTDEKMVRTMKELGRDLNPQKAYIEFKKKLTLAARKRAKEKVPKMQRTIDRLREDVRITLNPAPETEESDEARTARERHAAILQERLDDLEAKRFETARRCVAARHRIQDEMMTKRWASTMCGKHQRTKGRPGTQPYVHEQLKEDGGHRDETL
ncbi:DNase I-like protein [Cubamyces sp. BRFM 1775]|nr:DNase I-like protein [Cubamyces sp. BRFM 1775]